jgi:hypothetical protein
MPIKVDSAGPLHYVETIKAAHERDALKDQPSSSEASQLEAPCRPPDTDLSTIESGPASAGATGFDREMTRAYQDAQRLPSPLRERVLEELDYTSRIFAEFWSGRRKRIRRVVPRRARSPR